MTNNECRLRALPWPGRAGPLRIREPRRRFLKIGASPWPPISYRHAPQPCSIAVAFSCFALFHFKYLLLLDISSQEFVLVPGLQNSNLKRQVVRFLKITE